MEAMKKSQTAGVSYSMSGLILQHKTCQLEIPSRSVVPLHPPPEQDHSSPGQDKTTDHFNPTPETMAEERLPSTGFWSVMRELTNVPRAAGSSLKRRPQSSTSEVVPNQAVVNPENSHAAPENAFQERVCVTEERIAETAATRLTAAEMEIINANQISTSVRVENVS